MIYHVLSSIKINNNNTRANQAKQLRTYPFLKFQSSSQPIINYPLKMFPSINIYNICEITKSQTSNSLTNLNSSDTLESLDSLLFVFSAVLLLNKLTKQLNYSSYIFQKIIYKQLNIFYT